MDLQVQDSLKRAKQKLDGVSPSFCLAKWLQVTLHLQNGLNHSCHHPATHQTPLDELARDPSALHNTDYKKSLRAMMKAGKRPPECHYCWRVEDTPGAHFSDRVLKSADKWADSKFDDIVRGDPSDNVNPTYLEVSFGSECNFRCVYCDPKNSSSIWSSYERHGEYIGREPLSNIRASGYAPLKSEENPYVGAFWDWFPKLAPDLKVFRITGGEPLVNPNTFRLLDYIEANPLPNLQLAVNSNFGVPDPLFHKFLDKLKSLTNSGKIHNFMMFTSIDSHGTHAEYLRVGLNYHRWLTRVRTYLQEVPWNITFMVTFNALSVPRFHHLLGDITVINRDCQEMRGGAMAKRTLLDISHLTHPEYFSPWILNERWIKEIAALQAHMEKYSADNVGTHGFNWHEIFKIKRIAAWAAETSRNPPSDVAHLRALFYLFTNQYAVREGKEFLTAFPEMEDFHHICKEAFLSRDEGFRRAHTASPGCARA